MLEKTAVQAQMLANRLQKRFHHLKKWAQRKEIEAFRLYDRDIPEIPLVLDFYGACNAPEDAAICGALYKRPYDKDESDEIQWLSIMKNCAADTLGIKHENIFIKQRKRQKGMSQYERISHARYEKIIKEGNLLFKVNLSDYLDTGLFADRRLLREMVRSESKGKKVLNLFSYTGSFSVYAAAGGALSTDSVDISNTYLNWAGENFSLNGFTAQTMNAHRLIRTDSIEFINNAVKRKSQWDIIVVDPPVFSNSKKMTDYFDLNRDLTKLLNDCLKLLVPDGKIFLSVNLHRKAPSAHELEENLRSHTQTKNTRVIYLGGKMEDEDFKGRKIPKAFTITL
ncbi:MAG: class I SAM-dependent methyltransferase [Treponema sp.]|nr:class I SAM-dependent methyltransferase [Treponema sp.]